MSNLIIGINDFATLHPELLCEWNYKKNDLLGISPNRITCGTSSKVWWKCNVCGHEWQTAITNRSNRGAGCPKCAIKRMAFKRSLPKEGESLQNRFPDLVKEWNYEKNGDLLPFQVRYGTNRKVWWKCLKGHEWQASVGERTRGSGCPVCAGQEILVGYNDLATKYPNLVDEWNYGKNGNLLPTEVSCHTHRKVWWKCNHGHEWEAKIADRTRGNGCPYCAGKKVLAGYNDFESKFPVVAKEWHPTKNGGLKPNMVTWCSGKKVWWLCPSCGHEWQTAVSHRSSRGTGCPKCNSVHSTSFSEQAVFYYLRRYFPNALNRHKLLDTEGSFEVDVFLPSVKKAIEYDGVYWHSKRIGKDSHKEKRLKRLKIKLYRVLESKENKVVGNFIYYDFYHNYYNNLNWAIKTLLDMLGCGTLFVDEQIAEQEISNMFYTTETKNSLASRFPKLIEEWNYEKNGFLLPTMVKPFSDRKVWWKCSICGHEWISTVGNRSYGNGCPKCACEKISEKYSVPKKGCSITERFPQLIKEWHPTKNGNLSPTKISYGSNKKVWWLCSVCGYEWQTVVSSRTRPNSTGCPKCAEKNVGRAKATPKQGNSLGDRFPELLKDWDYKKNGDLLPSRVSFGSNKKVWWKCNLCGYSWEAKVSSRTSKHNHTLSHGCPSCANKVLNVGFNDLASKCPRLLKDWDYVKNNELGIHPDKIIYTSQKKVFWKCHVCGYMWEAKIYNRVKGSGCFGCSVNKMRKTNKK